MARLTLTATGTGEVLPPLTQAEARAVAERFRDLVGAIGEANVGNRAWWFSWLSSRDVNNTPLLAHMLWLAQLERRLAGGGDLTVACAEPTLAAAALRLARRHGWQATADAAARLAWRRHRLAALVRPLVDCAKAVGMGWLAWRAAQAHRRPEADLSGNRVLLVGWLDHRLLNRRSDRYLDVYYGPLAAMLEAQGERCLHIGPVMAKPSAIAAITEAAVAEPHARLVTIGHWLRPTDFITAALGALFGRIRLPADIAEPGLVRASLFRRTLYDTQARLLECGLARALAANPEARLIRLYENLPWERAVDLAAKAAGRHVIGYLHCAVVPSYLTFYIDERDQRVRPQPDRIVCTGPAARDVLLSLGSHDPQRVAGGMALRGPDPDSLTLRAGRPARLGTMLVLLEGLYKMTGLLRWLDQAARAVPELRIVVRAHPMLPLATLAEAAGIAAGPGQRLEPSTASTLEADIAGADVILYQGTTAALTAGLMGVPLLCYDAQQALPDDPLLRCSAFKRMVAQPADLAHSLREFEALDDKAWQGEKIALRDYVADYLRAPSAAALADFRVALPGQPAAD